jgi:acetyl/propionyl-CoA carboxylase alpha subunit
MSRALREYEVLGIRTTVPFFRWMLAQPAFLAAAFHTGYLDELLQQRGGEPFETADKDEEEAAAIGAALHLLSGRGPSVADPARSARQERHPASPGGRVGWKARARAEALRP